MTALISDSGIGVLRSIVAGTLKPSREGDSPRNTRRSKAITPLAIHNDRFIFIVL
jgi:hypothetical protein